MLSRQQEFIENFKRRTFDAEEAEQRMLEKKRAEDLKKNPPVRPRAGEGALIVRDILKRRETDLNLEARVGKYTVINANTTLANRGGFYCDVCECLLKDSISYLDHVNGKRRTFFLRFHELVGAACSDN